MVVFLTLMYVSASAFTMQADVDNDYASHARETFAQLQHRYWDHGIGRWNSSMWWQAANTVEIISNLGMQQPQSHHGVSSILAVVFNATSNNAKGRCDKGVDLTFSGYFDDEAWWGHAWLRAHLLTLEEKYLNRARAVFDDLVNRSWSNASCGGGFCWQASPNPADMKACYKNAITNELFLSLAAQLALVYKQRCQDQGSSNRAHEGRADCSSLQHVEAWADLELDWLMRSGMVNASFLVNDGLDTFTGHEEFCENNHHTAYTYNQGVILSGLAFMWQLRSRQQGARNNTDLLTLATKIVSAVWRSHLVYNGSHVLREMDEVDAVPLANLYSGSPGTDSLQFKSVFLRHLWYFLDVIVGDKTGNAQRIVHRAGGNTDEWQTAIQENADSIWTKAACLPPEPMRADAKTTIPALFGYLWRGPCSWAFGGPSATTQSAALDVFISADSKQQVVFV
eukprot:gnl/MRDRNA2_/MRDRNA2_143077_c0_seq1.p1 gnl/MRDRNA2_/MRDRNA2_143077_c0~~gnl/MRDRNA2_/MRDRNA2_143077_c0_seq1.p1  ORF type:complete len:453 (-),score=74.12 gnl/MRDRNA2_/MRDRNA2_143077_c0_seq1:18-1376(-)